MFIIYYTHTWSLFKVFSVVPWSTMVPASLDRMALAAWILRTSAAWCNDWSTSCESATVLNDDDEEDDDEDDSYASLTSLDVDTRRSEAVAYFCSGPSTVTGAATVFTGLGRTADWTWCSGDTLDTSTGGDSGNVTSGSPAPSAGAGTWCRWWWCRRSAMSASATSPLRSCTCCSWTCCSSCEFCSCSDEVVVISDIWRWTRCDVDDVDDDDDSIVRELDDVDDDVFCFDDAFWKRKQ